MRAYQMPQASGIDALGKVDLPTAKSKVTADEVRLFLPCLGQTRNNAPSAL
jgi:hypothetical protein